MSGDSKTFYLETFGCQMNVHDSEKVIGTLVHEGYKQVETVEQADLILYNTCSIRDKAEQKVFHRLADYKKLLAQGKKFGVLGCVAQQEGEKIFERAPHVSLVCGSASYRNLPQMLVQLEAGETTAGNSRSRKPDAQSLLRITGLDDRETDECFETEFTARTNPHRGSPRPRNYSLLFLQNGVKTARMRCVSAKGNHARPALASAGSTPGGNAIMPRMRLSK